MKKTDVRFITYTAVILALTIVFQSMGRVIPLGPNANFIVGPLVNACLIIAAAVVGFSGGCTIAVLAPAGAYLTGAAIPLPFLPFVAVGNAILVAGFCLLRKNQWAGLAVGAVAKFLFLWGSVVLFLSLRNKPLAGAMLFTFSWPQLVTAIVGGMIALGVLAAIRKTIRIGNYGEAGGKRRR